MWGIAKVGIHTPPMAAKSTVRVAPKGADCSCVFAKVPKSTPNPIAESPEAMATNNKGKSLPPTSNVGKPK